MDSKQLRDLMEAYSEVYAPEQLDEMGYTPGRSRTADAQVAKNRAALGNTILYGNSQGRTPSKPTAQQQMRQKIQANRPSATKPAAAPAAKPATPAPTPAAKPAPTPAAKPAPTPAAKPAATPTQAAKVAPSAAAKPAADKPSAMDQWAKANPRLAQAQKIKQQGGSRAEVNKALYNKGTAASGATPTVVKAGFDLFDLVKDYLLDGGYAETLEEAEWLMANVIDEEAIDIILGEEQLDELSNRTVSNALNARIAATGAASDRAYKHRNPQAMRAAEDAAAKEARMKGAVSRRRERLNKEEYMDEGVPLRGTTPDGKPWRVDPPSPSRLRQSTKMERNPKEKTSLKKDLGKKLKENKEAFEAWLDEAMSSYDRNRKRAAQRAAARNEARAQGKTGAVPGVGYVTPRRERETWTDESGKTRHAKGL